MTAFQRKPIASNKTLGERLRAIREKRGETLLVVAKRLHIRKGYVDALECGRYGELPGDIYIRNFLKRYAIDLELNPLSVLRLYEKERSILIRQGTQKVIRAPRAISRWSFFSPSAFLRPLMIAPVVILILVYLGIQLNAILSPPDLEVFQPNENMVIKDRSITVAGKSEGATDVRINGQPVNTDVDGYFAELVNLQYGVNLIEVTSAKKRSREASVVRHVLVETATTAASATP